MQNIIVFQTAAQIACSLFKDLSLSSLGHAPADACCRVRVSLGLKPLSMENSADTKRKEFDARQKVQAEQEKEAQAAALLERVQKWVSCTAYQAFFDYNHSILALALRQFLNKWTGLITPAQRYCTTTSLYLKVGVQTALATYQYSKLSLAIAEKGRSEKWRNLSRR